MSKDERRILFSSGRGASSSGSGRVIVRGRIRIVRGRVGGGGRREG